MHIKGSAVTLYNLSTDSGETQNVSGDNPTVTADLKAKLEAWDATLPWRYAKEGDSPYDVPEIPDPIISLPDPFVAINGRAAGKRMDIVTNALAKTDWR